MAGTKKIRGHSVPLPKWWLDEVNEKFSKLKTAKRITAVALAAELTKAAARDLAWDHKAVDRFLKGEVTTLEMMWAFLKVWPSLIPPVFIVHTKSAAERIIDELSGGSATPEWRNRYIELEEKLAEIAAPVNDQTRGVASKDEGHTTAGKPHSRRPRSVD